ncbi:MAG: oxidoreductase [Gemmobacter sp.]
MDQTEQRQPACRPDHPRIRRRALLMATAGLGVALAAPRLARATLAPPAGAVLLTVSGAIGRRNAGDAAVFDDAMLGDLPQVGFSTMTLWTPRVHFEGPPLSAVLAAAEARGRRIEALAANDFRAVLDPALIGPRAPIVARRIDGAPFPIRALGPLWIMFPFDDEPAFRTEATYMQCVWQLVALDVRAA